MSDMVLWFCLGFVCVGSFAYMIWFLWACFGESNTSKEQNELQKMENSVKECQNSYTPWIQNNNKFDTNRIHWYNAPGMDSYDIELLISSAIDFVYIYVVMDDDVTDFIRFSNQPPKDKDILIEGFKKIPNDVMRIGLKCSGDVKSLNREESETMYRYVERSVAKIKKDYLDKRPIEARQEICDIMNFLTHAGIWCEYK